MTKNIYCYIQMRSSKFGREIGIWKGDWKGDRCREREQDSPGRSPRGTAGQGRAGRGESTGPASPAREGQPARRTDLSEGGRASAIERWRRLTVGPSEQNRLEECDRRLGESLTGRRKRTERRRSGAVGPEGWCEGGERRDTDVTGLAGQWARTTQGRAGEAAGPVLPVAAGVPGT